MRKGFGGHRPQSAIVSERFRSAEAFSVEEATNAERPSALRLICDRSQFEEPLAGEHRIRSSMVRNGRIARDPHRFGDLQSIADSSRRLGKSDECRASSSASIDLHPGAVRGVVVGHSRSRRETRKPTNPKRVMASRDLQRFQIPLARRASSHCDPSATVIDVLAIVGPLRFRRMRSAMHFAERLRRDVRVDRRRVDEAVPEQLLHEA
jgi:hypothetical protein